ncbi:MAG TPA: hypothetical protein VKV25_09450, partial [Acidimicrobiales bacterium]|nr:hypothetical protein [Acidimicrobiales bacterium]
SVGMKLSATRIQLPGGKSYVNGDDCGGQPARVYVKEFPYPGATVGTLERTDPRDLRLANGALLTIAFVTPKQSSHIPEPPKAVQDALTKAITPTTTTTTVPASTSTSTTTPKSSSTTAASTTTTTAKGGKKHKS